MVGSVASGLADVRRGGAFLAARPRLWKLLVVPFAIAAALIAALIWVGFRWVEPMVADLLSFLPDWLGALVTAVNVLVLLLFFIGAYFVYVSVAMLLLAPFCEMLSEAIEVELTGVEPPPSSVATFLRDLVVGVVHATRRLLSYLVIVLLVFATGLVIPIVGPLLATAAGLFFTARAAAYDSYDAVWARKGWSYQDKMDYLAARRGRTFGLGATVAAMLAIPVANILALPFGAAGATLAYLDGAQPAT